VRAITKRLRKSVLDSTMMKSRRLETTRKETRTRFYTIAKRKTLPSKNTRSNRTRQQQKKWLERK